MTNLQLHQHRKRLRQAYEQHGCIRVKMDERRARVRSGWEIRLLARSTAEGRALSRSLRALGFILGSTFEKRGWLVIPRYGRAQVERFLDQTRPQCKSTVPAHPSRVDMRRRENR